MSTTQTAKAKPLSERQKKALVFYISRTGNIKNDLSRRIILWLLAKSEFMSKPVKVFIPENHLGIRKFSSTVFQDVQAGMGSPHQIDSGKLIFDALDSDFEIRTDFQGSKPEDPQNPQGPKYSGIWIYVLGSKMSSDAKEIEDLDFPSLETFEKETKIVQYM